MVLKKTFLGIRVLAVQVRWDLATQAELQKLRSSGGSSPLDTPKIVDSILSSDGIEVEIRFLRDFGLDRFLTEAEQNLECVTRSGAIHPEEYRLLVSQIPSWFSPLKDRGIRDGDRLTYEIHRESMRTIYRSADHKIWIDHADSGTLPHRSVLGSYFAECSEFRGPLLDSLRAD